MLTTHRLCWCDDHRGNLCLGKVEWTKREDGRWSSKCRKCHAEGRAATGEQLALEREAVASSVGTPNTSA